MSANGILILIPFSSPWGFFAQQLRIDPNAPGVSYAEQNTALHSDLWAGMPGLQRVVRLRPLWTVISSRDVGGDFSSIGSKMPVEFWRRGG